MFESHTNEFGKPRIDPMSRPKSGAFQKSRVTIAALGDWSGWTLMSQLPPRDICQRFFDSFLLGVHPVIPVCHLPTLKKEYTDFWSKFSPETPVNSLIHILAVLYTGAAKSTSTYDTVQSSTLYDLYETAIKAVDLDAHCVTSSSIQLLQGIIIMGTFRASQVSPFSAFGFLPRVIRFAQSLRVHVEPDSDNPVAEVRRRIWWHLISLDVESTIASGLESIIRPGGYTTGLPSVVVDDEIQANGSSTSIADTPQSLSPMLIAMRGYWQWSQRMQAWFERMPAQADVTQFIRAIENLLGLLGDDEASEWPRMYLTMQIHRAYCMLGLRFWQLDQFDGTDCYSEVVK